MRIFQLIIGGVVGFIVGALAVGEPVIGRYQIHTDPTFSVTYVIDTSTGCLDRIDSSQTPNLENLQVVPIDYYETSMRKIDGNIKNIENTLKKYLMLENNKVNQTSLMLEVTKEKMAHSAFGHYPRFSCNKNISTVRASLERTYFRLVGF